MPQRFSRLIATAVIYALIMNVIPVYLLLRVQAHYDTAFMFATLAVISTGIIFVLAKTAYAAYAPPLIEFDEDLSSGYPALVIGLLTSLLLFVLTAKPLGNNPAVALTVGVALAWMTAVLSWTVVKVERNYRTRDANLTSGS